MFVHQLLTPSEYRQEINIHAIQKTSGKKGVGFLLCFGNLTGIADIRHQKNIQSKSKRGLGRLFHLPANPAYIFQDSLLILFLKQLLQYFQPFLAIIVNGTGFIILLK